MWTGKNLPFVLLVQHDKCFVQEWQNAQKGLVEDGHAHHAPITRWLRPARGTLKCNVDGAIFGAAQLVSVGCIIRNEDGALCHATFRTIHGCFSPAKTEAMDLYVPLTWIRELSLCNVILESRVRC